MNVSCPRCGQRADVADSRAGSPVKCARCGQVFNARAAQTGRGGAGSGRRSARPGPGAMLGNLLLFLLLMAAAGFGYAMLRFQESPGRTWERLTRIAKSFRSPDPSSMPEETPTPTPPTALAQTTPVPPEPPSPALAMPAADATATPATSLATGVPLPTPLPPVTTRAFSPAEAELALGAVYTRQATTFRLFAPTAQAVNVVLYNGATGALGRNVRPLARRGDSFWELKLPGDWQGKFYCYQLAGPGLDSEREVLDPYATNAVASSTRGRITDLGAPPAHRGPVVAAPTDMVVYEMHVRDFTSSPTSGARHRGLYFGFTETDTHLPEDEKIRTGLDHLVELGVTHVELLPVQDFANDEAKGQFNWGYITTAFLSPEGMYATSPDDDSRVRELKALIDALHARGIGVIMDVVYNHTANDTSLQSVAPGYYYRHLSGGELANGSGCGNETRSEAPAARKLILDSLKLWTTTYGVDGYRFDLMALIDQDTMREAARELRAINPGVALYGEPWMGGDSPLQSRTDKTALRQVPVGAFNDDFRNALKGSPDGNDPGFIQNGSNREALKGAMQVSAWLAEPGQSVNYMTCHDNLVLWDKLKVSMPGADEATLIKTMKLGYLALFTSQGMPFFQGGEEFARTKGGNNNSYDAPDAVNQVDWSLKRKYFDLFTYTRDLIALRKAHPVFRLRTRREVEARLQFPDTTNGKVLVYTLNGAGVAGENWRQVCVVLNSGDQPADVTLPGGGWTVAINEAGKAAGGTAAGKTSVRAKAGLVLFQR